MFARTMPYPLGFKDILIQQNSRKATAPAYIHDAISFSPSLPCPCPSRYRSRFHPLYENMAAPEHTCTLISTHQRAAAAHLLTECQFKHVCTSILKYIEMGLCFIDLTVTSSSLFCWFGRQTAAPKLCVCVCVCERAATKCSTNACTKCYYGLWFVDRCVSGWNDRTINSTDAAYYTENCSSNAYACTIAIVIVTMDENACMRVYVCRIDAEISWWRCDYFLSFWARNILRSYVFICNQCFRFFAFVVVVFYGVGQTVHASV